MSARVDAAKTRTYEARGRASEEASLLTKLEAKLAEETKKAGTLEQRIAKVTAEVAELKKDARVNPKKYGPALQEMSGKLAMLQSQLAAANDEKGKLGKAVTEHRTKLSGAQGDALTSAKQANAYAADDEAFWKPAPFRDAQYIDSMLDAASLSPAKQRELLGAATSFTTTQAHDYDVAKVKAAIARGPDSVAVQVLKDTLQGTAPENRSKLLVALKHEVAFLAGAAAKDEGTAKTYLGMMEHLDDKQREAMLGEVARHLKGDTWGSGFGKALDAQMKDGAHFDSAATLVGVLDKLGKTEESGTLRGLAARSLKPLRENFEAKAKKAEELRHELALLNDGFGPLMTEPQRKAAIDAFTAQHKSEFAALNEAGAKLAGATEFLARVQDPKTGGTSNYAWNGNQQLEKEAKELAEILPQLQKTPAGETVVQAALLKQKDGEPSWLDGAVTLVKDRKDLTEGLAKVVTSGLGSLALAGDVTANDGMVRLLQRNAGLLGVDAGKLEELRNAFIDANGSVESTERLKKAFNNIEGGVFGKSDTAKNALKIFGLGLTMYGVGKGVKDWGDSTNLQRFKTVVEGAKLGVDGAALAVEMMGKETALKSLTKLGGGLSMVSGVVDVISGIDGIRNGNTGEGVADIMTGAGGMMMGLAAVSSSVPGGQLIGATLAVAGLVTKLVVGNRKAAKAEEASEKDARVFLEAGSVPKPIAAALANVRRTDHGNVGRAIVELAPKLGLTKEQFFAKLQKLPTAELERFVDMALDLKQLPDGHIQDKSLGFQASEFKVDSPEIKDVVFEVKGGAPSIKYYPQSLESAAGFTKKLFADNGL